MGRSPEGPLAQDMLIKKLTGSQMVDQPVQRLPLTRSTGYLAELRGVSVVDGVVTRSARIADLRAGSDSDRSPQRQLTIGRPLADESALRRRRRRRFDSAPSRSRLTPGGIRCEGMSRRRWPWLGPRSWGVDPRGRRRLVSLPPEERRSRPSRCRYLLRRPSMAAARWTGDQTITREHRKGCLISEPWTAVGISRDGRKLLVHTAGEQRPAPPLCGERGPRNGRQRRDCDVPDPAPARRWCGDQRSVFPSSGDRLGGSAGRSRVGPRTRAR